MRHTLRPRRRQAFTIVELLVAMALIIFIMYVLAEAFAAGTTVFRNLKAVGDMNERLRGASNLLRRYLSAEHFDGRRRLSDPDFWKNGPPTEGFFRIWQNTAPVVPGAQQVTLAQLRNSGYVEEGTDLDGNKSYLARDHGLHFTVRLRGNNRSDYFQTRLPANSPLFTDQTMPYPGNYLQEQPQAGTPDGVFAAQWAEIAIYLKPTGEFTETKPDVDPPNTNTVTELPLYALHVRQRLLVPANDDVTTAVVPTPATNLLPYLEVSHQSPDPRNQNRVYFNNPADLTMPIRRFKATATAANFAGTDPPSNYPTLRDEIGTNTQYANQIGGDVLLTDVLSMEVRVLLSAEAYITPDQTRYNNAPQEFISFSTGFPVVNPNANPPIPPRPIVQEYSMGNTAFGNAQVFDTWSSRKDDSYEYSLWDVRSTDNPKPTGYDVNKVIPLYKDIAGNKIRIRAIQIIMRIWDEKTKQARQTSVVVEL